MFCIKIHEKFGVKILAICDIDVIDKEFEYRGVKLKVSKDFYFERTVNQNELLSLISNESFNVINAFGKNVVNLLIEKGLISEKNILIIDGQKHAILQIL
ncbi:MAG: DUF424 family protein [Candidatus Aenigmatarchaeota archaeon]